MGCACDICDAFEGELMISYYIMHFKVQVWGLMFGVWGLGFGVWGLGFGVWGLNFDARGQGAWPVTRRF